MIREALILFLLSAIFGSPVWSQRGFISLDCGATENYTDDAGVQWMPDDAYINSGKKKLHTNVNVGGDVSRQLNTLRCFPERRKSCYQLTPVEFGTKYLLRGTFVYGNYDNRDLPPQFDLLLDADLWDGLSFSDSSTYVVQKEIIFMAKFDPTNVCLARNNDSYGIPIISSLELRPLNKTMYSPVSQDYSLLTLERTNFGAKPVNSIITYPDDLFDRLWSATVENFPPNTTQMNVSIGTAYDQPPTLVMQTAETSDPSSPSVIDFPLMRLRRQIGIIYISMYFAELQPNLNSSTIREFDLFLDDDKLNNVSIQPKYLQSSSVSVLKTSGTSNTLAFHLRATNRSPLPPIANSLEIYRLSDRHRQGTFTTDGIYQIKD